MQRKHCTNRDIFPMALQNYICGRVRDVNLMICDNAPAVFVCIGHQVISGVSKTAANATALCASWQRQNCEFFPLTLTLPVLETLK